MAERRPLIAGLKPVAEADPAREKEFVYGDRHDPERQGKPLTTEPKSQNTVSRVPLTTRVRADLAAALKRATLERKLAGVTPNAVQEILEDALEPWLRTHGYVK